MRIKLLYNIYFKKGLLFFVICSSGRKSFFAVLVFVKIDYLFFVVKKDGIYIFLKIFEDYLKV